MSRPLDAPDRPPDSTPPDRTTRFGLLAFALAIYATLLASAPGRVVADTKSYLYLDPSRFLSRATSLWDPHVGAGTVTHQTIGYLWPMGPYYWTLEQLGAPDWVAQRLWLGSIVVAAALGTAFLLRTLGWRGLPVLTAAVLYGLTPHVVSIAPRLSVILLPYAGLPWLLGLVIRAARRGGWRHPALFALTVATVGSINATALVLVGVAPVLWLAWSVATRELEARRALGVALRIGVLTTISSAWWAAGLWVQATNGIDILQFTETAQVVAGVSTAHEVLRGLGYWYFYGGDRLGPWIEPSVSYQDRLALLMATYLAPAAALALGAATRWSQRAYFALLLLVGLVLSVGAHPWDGAPPVGAALQAMLETDRGLAMRSMPRAAPMVVLALAVMAGAGVASVARRRPRVGTVTGVSLMALAAIGVPALWSGSLVPDNLDRAEEVPAHWEELAHHLDATDDGTRVLEVPGSDFATHRWGTTVDPILPGLMDRPYLARELIPYGSEPSADLLNAFDERLQEQMLSPEAIAPMARLLRAGTISARSDLEFERFNTPRPRSFWDLLTSAPDLDAPSTFGPAVPNVPSDAAPMEDAIALLSDPTLVDPPPVAAFDVRDPNPILTAGAGGVPLLVAGDGAGLVDLADAGLLRGDERILYAGQATLDRGELATLLDEGAALVVTDTNRKAGRRWGSVRYNRGYTERADESLLEVDPTDNRLDLFPDAGTDSQTVAVALGDLRVSSSSFGNSITMAPEERPANAVDGDPTTAWRTAALGDSRGERIVVTLDRPRDVRSLRLLQPVEGHINRFVTRVRITRDEGPPVVVDLDEQSRSTPGQVVPLPAATTTQLTIEILADTAGPRPRYTGQTSVGFAEIEVGELTSEEVIRPPVDLLRAVGTASRDHDLSFVLTRRRAPATDDTRADEELRLRRLLELPTARSFSLEGDARLSSHADGPVLDALLGRTGATVTADRTIPGGQAATASMALDGDPATAWQSTYGDDEIHWLDVERDRPIVASGLDLVVRADGRHSIPTMVTVTADGAEVGTYPVPAIQDVSEPDGTVEVHVPFGREVGGTHLRFEFSQVSPRITLAWSDGAKLQMPIGIAELGLSDVRVSAPDPQIDTGCRQDLLEVDGQPVGIRLRGSTADALAGAPLELSTCGTPLSLPAGTSVLRTADGRQVGFDVDRLVLRSAAGGGPGESGVLAEAPTPRRLEVRSQSSTRLQAVLAPGGTGDGGGGWLVLGQSHNLGWRATVDGSDLGPPVLVDGFANGWRLPAGSEPVEVEITFTPQRRVDAALAISVVGVLACVVLALRRPRPAPVLARPAIRLPDLRGTDPALAPRAALLVVAAGAVASLLLLPLPYAVGAVVFTALSCRGPRWLSLVGPAAVGAATAWVVLLQARDQIIPGYEWALETVRPHSLTMLGVWMVVISILLSSLRHRSGGPALPEEPLS